jgi:hypothetical protein
MIKLIDLQFQIQYKQGINNATADALSRNTDVAEVWAISEGVPTWIQKVQEGYSDDPVAQ